MLTCGFGLAAAGGIGTPGIGGIGDIQIARYLDDVSRRNETVAVLEGVRARFPQHAARAQAAAEPLEEPGYVAADVERALRYTAAALHDYEARGRRIQGNATPQALRAILATGIAATDEPLVARAGDMLIPAEAYAGPRALLLIAWIPLLLVASFGCLYLVSRRKGGYRPERLAATE